MGVSQGSVENEDGYPLATALNSSHGSSLRRIECSSRAGMVAYGMPLNSSTSSGKRGEAIPRTC
jgi:hypothetical protein